MALNEQFLGVLYKKLAALSGPNRFNGINTFKNNVTVEGKFEASGSFATPLQDDTVTIASGSVTLPNGSFFKIDTESAASTDDLDTIAQPTSGRTVRLRPANTSRTVVIKHGTGNIQTFDGSDISLDETYKSAVLIYDSGLGTWLATAASLELLDEDDMSSDSNTQGATQQSIKAYVDAEVAGATSVISKAATYTARS